MSQLFTQSLRSAGDMLVDALIAELRIQGHSNTGKLIQSIVYEVGHASDAMQLDLSFEKYGAYIDKGLPPSAVPYTPGSGRKNSRYIRALMLWVTQRGIVSSQRQAKSMAFAIARKHSREGMPTQASSRFSGSGRRTGFFSGNPAFQRVEQQFASSVQAEVESLIDLMLSSIATQISNQ